MRYFIITILFFLTMLSFEGYGQDSVYVNGVVQDKSTKQQLSFAHIRIPNSNYGTAADVFGRFTLKMDISDLPANLLVTYLGYVTISLVSTAYQLDEVTVKLNQNLIYGTPKYQVMDYAIVSNAIVMVAFKKRISNAQLMLSDTQGEIKCTMPIKGNPVKLFTDCTGDLYLINQLNPYRIEIHADSMELVFAEQDMINRLMNPCVGFGQDRFFYRRVTGANLSTKYYTINEVSGEYNDFYETSQWQTNTAPKGYINVESRDIEASFWPLSTSLFVGQDSVVVFDHFNGHIAHLDFMGDVKHKDEIRYNERDGWCGRVFRDQCQGKFYTLFSDDKETTIARINIDTGKSEDIKKLGFSFIENVQVANDTLYFIARQNQKRESKYLFFEPLNSAKVP
jgi:hypothetical protein